MHKIATHVDENDPQLMNIVRNNAQKAASYHKSKGEQATKEDVASTCTSRAKARSPTGLQP